MYTTYLLVLTPFITAGIGWLTNWVAIKMLFYPKRPIHLLRFKWQGLIPRRQQQLASEAAEIIEREILQQNMITSEIKKIDLTPHLQEAAHRLVWERIGPQLKGIPLIGGLVNETTLTKFEVIATVAMKEEAGTMMSKVASQFETQIDFRTMIETKIAGFDLDHLESIVNQVAKREFRTIELLGALLGFLIGCVQVGLFYVTGSIEL